MKQKDMVYVSAWVPVTIGEDISYFHASSQRREPVVTGDTSQISLECPYHCLFLTDDYANWFAVSVLTVLAI